MATVNKNFKIKSGLIVEGSTATVGGNQVLTENASDQYILDLIGGETLVKSVSSELNVDGSGQLSIDRNVTDDWYDASGDAAAAELNAKNYTDGEISTALTTAQGYANNAESAAIASANSYTDAEISDEVAARDAAISLSLGVAESYADTAAGNAESAAILSANSHTDSQIALEATRADLYADSVGAATLLSANNTTSSSIATEATRADNYADSVGTSTLSSANSYTDAEIVTALSTAASDATIKADAAEANAKAYADGLSSGLNWKAAVNVLATSNVALTGSSPLAIDGHTVSNGYRVLLKAQSVGTEDGIYAVSITGGTYTLVRPADADSAAELVGAAVFVMEGDNYASTAWVQSDHYLTTFAGQEWTQFSGQGTYLAGNGINLDGTTFSIDTDVTATKAYADQVSANAYGDATLYTDSAITTEVTNRNNAIATAKTEAILTAEGYTDSELAAEVIARNSAISTAKTEAINTAEDYTDAAIFAEVGNRDSAISTAVAGGIIEANVYADGLITDEIADRNLAITNAINAVNTDDIEEGATNLYFTNARAIAAVGGTIGDVVNALTTDDIEEGVNNLYFEDYRATAAVSNELGTGIVYSAENAGNVFHIDENVVATRTYAQDVANTAQSNAESTAQFYANNAENNAINTASDDATFKANAAEANAISAAALDATSKANTAQLNAEGYTDAREIAITSAYQAYADQAETDAVSTANAYTDQSVAALVDSAPELLDTLNELAAALGDSPDTITNLTTSIGEKVAKSGDTMTGALAMSNNNITGLGTPSAVDHAATKGYVDGEMSTQDAAAQGYANDAQAAAEATAAAALADVLDATTSFSAVNLNDVAKQVAAQANIVTASTQNAVVWSKTDYRSAEFLVKIKNGSHTEISKVMLTLDTSDNIAITEYAMVGTNGTLGSFTATVSGSTVILTVTTLNDNSDVMVVGTLLK